MRIQGFMKKKLGTYGEVLASKIILFFLHPFELKEAIVTSVQNMNSCNFKALI